MEKGSKGFDNSWKGGNCFLFPVQLCGQRALSLPLFLCLSFSLSVFIALSCPLAMMEERSSSTKWWPIRRSTCAFYSFKSLTSTTKTAREAAKRQTCRRTLVEVSIPISPFWARPPPPFLRNKPSLLEPPLENEIQSILSPVRVLVCWRWVGTSLLETSRETNLVLLHVGAWWGHG